MTSRTLPINPTEKAKSIFERYYMPEPNSGCWLWMNDLSKKGYGSFKHRLAHRASYQLFKGPIRNGLFVLHKCDVACCVNPDHLYLGGHAQNVEDARKRDRFHRWKGARSGEKNPKAVLTWDRVAAIRQDLANGAKVAAIAARENVRPETIRNVGNHKSWKARP